MKHTLFLCAGLMTVLLACGTGRGEDSAADLRRQIEDLQTKLSLAEKNEVQLEKECEALRKENARLKGAVEQPDAKVNDPFRVGVVWLGEAKASGKVLRWAVSISERDGQNFKGVVAVVMPDGKTLEHSISGTAPNTESGLVVLESPLVGRAKMFLRGRLSNGEVALAFSATNRLGDKFFGSATLRPKN